MGLDMYLRATTHVADYDWYDEDDRKVYQSIVEDLAVGKFVDPHTRSGEVELVVGYWRKANHIHNWFVQNVQGGEDECKPHDVSREQLEELRTVCLRILALQTEPMTITYGEIGPDHRITEKTEEGRTLTRRAAAEADKVLPTAAGFFFGSTAYDEWFLRDTEETVKIIDRVLDMPPRWYFVYQSSW